MSIRPPRRISRTARFSYAGLLAVLLSAPLLVAILRSGDGGAVPVLATAAVAVGLIVVALMVDNVGLAPRLEGQYLDVTTVLGRQSLDLAALTGIRWERGRNGAQMIRLRDQITDVIITVPPSPAIRDAVREGLVAASGRGLVLPRRVTAYFNLPQLPNAPRNKTYSGLPMAIAFLAFTICLGLAAGLILNLIR